ncbi:MAG: phosphoglycerate kinase [Finegoldia sp.]|nr:phosphoglycerate kinase [Finegoldia sp.]
MNKKILDDIDVKGKKVLVRVDYNVPIKDGEITDNNRIEASLPTLKYLLDKDAALILISHLGRPKGKVNRDYSLDPVAKELSRLLERDVKFLDSDMVVDEKIKEEVSNLKNGEIALLQNTRFRPEEEKNDDEFAKDLASLADLYVNDAFGTCHRAHASNVGVSKYLPSAVGRLVEKELEQMGNALENPQRPFLAILGGAKVSDKIGVIDNLIDKVDTFLIGGAMAFTFLKAQGINTGKSLVEDEKLDLANDLLKKAQEKGVKLILPVDFVVAKEISDDVETTIVDYKDIKDDEAGFDIGPSTVKLFDEEIQKAKTIIWNGPMGVFELDNFNKGTFGVADSVAASDATTIIGGGDSAAAIEKSGNKTKVTHVSTGGGASLEFLEGKVLPGIDAIEDK